jgi:hypothetical protein
MALIPLIMTVALIAGVLAEPPALSGGRSEIGPMARCLTVGDAANPTVAQRLPGYVPVESLGGAWPRRFPHAERLDPCNAIPRH